MDEVRKEAARREQLACVNSLLCAPLGKPDVDPAGEEALLVPDALAVAEKQKPVGGRLAAHVDGVLDANELLRDHAGLLGDRCGRQHDLERVRLGCGSEHVVGLLGLPSANWWVANEVGSSRPPSISFSSFGVVVVSTEAGRDHHVADPELLEMQRRAACRARRRWRRGRPGRISSVQSSNVSGTPTASIATSAPRPPVRLHHLRDRVLAAVVDRDVGAELERLLEPRVGEIDRDDPARACAASRS